MPLGIVLGDGEAVGDADAVASTALGLKNLQRVSNMLLTATTAKKGEPYDDLAELYGGSVSLDDSALGGLQARVLLPAA